MSRSRVWMVGGCAGGLWGWGLACTGAGTEGPIVAPDPAPVEQPAVDEDPAKYVGKWFYLRSIADGCATGAWQGELQVGATEFRGPGQLVDLSADNPEQVLDVLSSEKRGDDWILKVRIGDYEGERLVRWTRFGEEMVFGMPEDGGVTYVRLDHPVDVVQRAYLSGTRCGGGDRGKAKGKAGKHKGG